MKKTLLYSVMALALALVLGLILPVTVMAQGGHAESKYTKWDVSSGHPEDVYLVGQTVYYCLNITNNETGSLSITQLLDRVPVDIYTGDPTGATNTYWWDDFNKLWVDEDPNYEFSIPGEQSWNVTFNYTIREGDASWHSGVGYNVMMNRFCANGTAGELGCDTATVRVIQPAIELVKTVDPSVTVPGQNVTYTFNITNTGDWPLKDITLDDDVLGNLTGELPSVLNATGEVGDSYNFDYEYEIQAGDLPLVNEATVEGTAQGFNATIFSDAVVSDSDTATVTSEAPPVGGTAYPVNTLSILAPWIALGAAIIAGAAIFVRRRQVRS